ncbi:MAG TPA: V-type ATP synthase subunit E family protein [Candidatus Norongarragalinales archaeon]|nr:V-type ATP synthase subunit E family protein [Candidatus Norongarragalinales archaeon]
MSLDGLKQELKRKTAIEVARIENEGKAEARRIREDARKDAEKREKIAEKEADEFVEREKMRIPAARLKARRIIQDAKYGMVERALAELGEILEKKTANKREYEKMLGGLIEQGIREIGSKDPVIMVRKQDAAFGKKFGKVMEIECMGGAIIASEDGRMRINNTFEALMEKGKEGLEQQAFELMFGKSK